MGIRKLRNDIGKKLKNLRLEKGLSQEKLAELVDLSREYITLICQENIYLVSKEAKIFLPSRLYIIWQLTLRLI